LRTPIHDKDAYIVSVSIEDLSAAGEVPLNNEKSEIQSIPVTLPENTGIRDLAALKGGGLLILAGPTQDQEDVGYHLDRLEKPVKNGNLELLGEIKTDTKQRTRIGAKRRARRPISGSLTAALQLLHWPAASHAARMGRSTH
jgi:hypothetical protein